MAKDRFRRVNDWRKVQSGKRFELADEWKTKKRFSTYRDGQFWIGIKMIARWDPDSKSHPGDGIFLNKKNGNFEAWKDARLISKIHWKRDWKEVVTWGDRFIPREQNEK